MDGNFSGQMMKSIVHDWLEMKFRFIIHQSLLMVFYCLMIIGIAHRLCLDGIQSFSVSPGKRYTIAAFVPERKGQPAIVRLYDISNFKQALAQKTFFRGILLL